MIAASRTCETGLVGRPSRKAGRLHGNNHHVACDNDTAVYRALVRRGVDHDMIVVGREADSVPRHVRSRHADDAERGGIVAPDIPPVGRRALPVRVDQQHLCAVAREAAAIPSAKVVLPTPPFWLISPKVGMISPYT